MFFMHRVAFHIYISLTYQNIYIYILNGGISSSLTYAPMANIIDQGHMVFTIDLEPHIIKGCILAG